MNKYTTDTIILGQNIDIKIIDSKYSDSAFEVEILEGTFKGKKAIVEKCNINIEKMTKPEIIEYICNKYNISYNSSAFDDTIYYSLYGSDYNVSIGIIEKVLHFDCSTLNNNGTYLVDESSFKNQRWIKSTKALENYILKYIDR